jgi:hypothetical protein
VRYLTAFFIFIGLGVGVWQFFWPLHPAVNPDPNHMHADFAVWIGKSQVNFALPQYMSGTADERDPNHQKHHLYYHLHDGNGHIIHRHKPDLPLGDFFATLGMEMIEQCMKLSPTQWVCNEEGVGIWRLYINGKEEGFHPGYVFRDLDHLLLTYDDGSMPVRDQLNRMTNDSCLYSKTCPWRGAPPIENCIADPTVPCTE